MNHLLRNLTLLENQYDEVVAKEVELDKMVIDKFKNKKIISALIQIMQNKDIPDLKVLLICIFWTMAAKMLSKMANMMEDMKAVEEKISGIEIGPYNYDVLANIKSDLFYVNQHLWDVRSGLEQAQWACERAESEASAMRTDEEKEGMEIIYGK